MQVTRTAHEFMSVTVRWEDEARQILRYTFYEDWDWAAYYTALVRGREMMATVEHWVCVLNDFTPTKHLPSAFFTYVPTIIETRPPNTGLAVFVSNHPFFRSAYATFARLYPHFARQYWLVSSEGEAQEALRQWLRDQDAGPNR